MRSFNASPSRSARSVTSAPTSFAGKKRVEHRSPDLAGPASRAAITVTQPIVAPVMSTDLPSTSPPRLTPCQTDGQRLGERGSQSEMCRRRIALAFAHDEYSWNIPCTSQICWRCRESACRAQLLAAFTAVSQRPSCDRDTRDLSPTLTAP